MEKQQKVQLEKQPLWTGDFTTLILGSVVSMLGNSMTGFAISLFILDYTGLPFYYALYVFLYTLPQITAPLLAGPLMDRFSRRRTIYLLDFTSSAIYLIAAVLVGTGRFNFAALAALTFVSGTINSTYLVAFDSFFPMLVTRGNYSKAYSVSSTLYELALVMIPVAAFLYNTFGITPILLANAVCFLAAALFEVRISDVERLDGNGREGYSARRYLADSQDGFRYLTSEKGLLLIAAYFAFSFLGSGASLVIVLPWFRSTFENGEYIYMSVVGFSVLGRAIGGLLHYKWKLPARRKFAIALGGYITISAIEGAYLYTPLWVMRLLCFLAGIGGVTSYTIRVSSTQAYVPNELRGRFNGAFLMVTTAGSLLGELLGGAAVTVMPMRAALSLFMSLVVLAALVFICGGRKYIQPIYNTQA